MIFYPLYGYINLFVYVNLYLIIFEAFLFTHIKIRIMTGKFYVDSCIIVDVKIERRKIMLKIAGKYLFEVNLDSDESMIMYYEKDEDEGEDASYSIEILYKDGNFIGEEVSPYICIGDIYTDKESVEELAGSSFSMKSVEESMDREDTFYIFEHEPFISYDLEILEIKDEKAHIKCSGTFISDGYTRPAVRDEFELDDWVKVWRKG